MSQYQCQNWRALIKIPSDFRKQPLLRVAENTERAVDWVGAVQQLKSLDHLAGTGSSASLPLMVVVTIRAVNEASRNLQWPEKAAWSAKIHGQTPPGIFKVCWQWTLQCSNEWVAETETHLRPLPIALDRINDLLIYYPFMIMLL